MELIVEIQLLNSIRDLRRVFDSFVKILLGLARGTRFKMNLQTNELDQQILGLRHTRPPHSLSYAHTQLSKVAGYDFLAPRPHKLCLPLHLHFSLFSLSLSCADVRSV